MTHASHARPAPSSSAAASSAAPPPIIWRGWAGSDVVLLERAQAHQRLDLACGRPRRPAAHLRQHHPAAQVQRRALRPAGAGDRPGDRLEDERRPAARLQRRALTEIKRQATTAHSFGLEMHLLSPAEAQDALAAAWTIGDVVGAAFLPTDGQANPVRHHAGAGQGRAHARRHDRRGLPGHRRSASRAGASPASCTAHGRRSLRDRRQLRRPMGPADRRARRRQRAAAVRSSISISSPSRSRACRATCRRCAIPTGCTYFKEEVGGLVMGGYEPEPDCLGARRHSRRLPLPAARRRLGPFRAA